MLITAITSTLSFLLFLSLFFHRIYCQSPPRNNREAILAKSRQYLRYLIMFLCLVSSICLLLLAMKPINESTSTISIQLHKLPELFSISMYIFIGCYFLQTSRLVSGTGDDSGRIKVRYLQSGCNCLLYVGYLICTIASTTANEKNTWKYLSIFLGVISIIGGFIIIGLGRWLTSLVNMVPDLPTLIRETMISRISIITSACAVGLFLPGLYDVLLGSSVLGNEVPYPISGNISSISSTTVDIWNSIPTLLLLVIIFCLLRITSSNKKKATTNAAQAPLIR